MAVVKTPIQQLDAAIGRILKQYGEEVDENVAEIAVRLAHSGASSLRAASKSTFGGKGRYAKGWTATVERKRTGVAATIHNAATPGLPHLLEHGHAKRGGGRVPGRSHIAPVEEKIVETFEREVVSKL